MPRLKPLPEGPSKLPSPERPSKEDIETTRTAALVAWTNVFRVAVDDPIESVQAISGEISRALRDILRTWNIHRDKAERIELAVALSCLKEGKRSPDSPAAEAQNAIDERQRVTVVPNLIDKLAGRAPMTLRDAAWLLGAVVHNWPERFVNSDRPGRLQEDALAARTFALEFLKALVLEKTGGISGETRNELAQDFARELDFLAHDQTPAAGKGLDHWIFPLVHDGDSRDILGLLNEAATKPGGLIIASSDKIFIEDDPVQSITDFAELAKCFSRKEETGLLIYVVDAGFVQRRPHIDRRRSIFNIHVLISALTSFAVLGDTDSVDADGSNIQRNLERWKIFKERCCIVLRGFSVIQSTENFSLALGPVLDRRIRETCGWSENDFEFETVQSLSLGASIDGIHVLPNAFPDWVDSRRAMVPKDLNTNAFHLWNVLVEDNNDAEELEISYFIVPKQVVSGSRDSKKRARNGESDESARRYFSGGIAYLTQCKKSKDPFLSSRFDDAQRMVYQAARGRLRKDAADRDKHQSNMQAVAELRAAGFEVMPVEVALIMLSNFPSRRTWSSVGSGTSEHKRGN